MNSRLPPPNRAEFSPAQRDVYESIARSRGSVEGPFLAWLHSPQLASRAERLGSFCRWGTVLSPRESELIILTVAVHYQCEVQWQSHEPIARQAGLTESTILAIHRRENLVLADPRLAVLRGITMQLLETNRIEQALFDAAQGLLGSQALVEAIGVLSYYAFMATTCNAFALRLECSAAGSGAA